MITVEYGRTQSADPTMTDRPRGPAEAGPGQARIGPREWISVRHPLWSMSRIVARATVASLLGLGAFVLAVIGLSDVAPLHMLAAGGILLAAGFFALSAIDEAWGRMFGFPQHATMQDRTVYFGGMTAALGTGLAALVLSILFMVFPAAIWLAAVTMLVLGAGLLCHSGIMQQVSGLTHDVAVHGAEGPRANEPFPFGLLSLAAIRDAVIGAGSIVLGILALLFIAPGILMFVSMLAIGLALTFSASTMCAASLVTLRDVCAKRAADAESCAVAM